MKQKGITPRHLTSNSAPVDMSGVRIEVLNPGKGPPPGEDLNDREINERALVLQLRWGDTAFLLPSDIGEPTESKLVARYRTLASGVLLSPHHGSHWSSSQPFLRAVRPDTIVISTGRPVRDDVLERYRQTGPPSSARTCTGPSASPRTGAVTRSFPSKAHDLYCLSGVNVLAIQVQILLLGVMPS